MSGAGSLKDVALRPWPAQKKEELSKEELYRQVFQLTEERGHLRGITEQTLQEEIDAGKDIPEDVMQGVEQDLDKEDEPSTKEKLEEVQRTRMEMMGHLDWAIFAASNALDLISLILSQDPNKRADSSFSYQFKQQGVPLGSFGVAEEHHEHRTKKEVEIQRDFDTTKRQQLVMKGARMEGLDAATDDLLKAATQLEKEVRKETKYWEEVLSISRKGWSIQRMRQSARQAPFAVRYGLPEASDHFKARGFAPLRMDQDGSIILDPALSLQPKTLRVRICDSRNTLGTSYLPSEAATELAIEKSIQLARDSLFEEELYHEMSLETRQLLAYGVELRDSVIHVSTPGLGARSAQRKILIDCIPRDDNVVASQDRSQDWLAQNIAEVLRLLLAHEHSMRLYRRSQLPAPLTAQKKQKPTPPLLRTLIALFRHVQGVDTLHAYLGDVVETLESAGLKVSLDATRETSWSNLTKILDESKKQDLSAVNQLLEVFMRPFDGQATLTLPSCDATQSDGITIATRTVIGAPPFGTEHKLTLPSSFASSVLGFTQDHVRQFKFSSTEEIKSYLDWILSLDIAHTLKLKDYAGKSTTDSRKPRISITKENKKGVHTTKDVLVELKDARLTARVVDPKLPDAQDAEQTCAWGGQKAEASLRDVVRKWVS